VGTPHTPAEAPFDPAQDMLRFAVRQNVDSESGAGCRAGSPAGESEGCPLRNFPFLYFFRAEQRGAMRS